MFESNVVNNMYDIYLVMSINEHILNVQTVYLNHSMYSYKYNILNTYNINYNGKKLNYN